MDITHLPMVSYFVDWRNVTGTYILGFLGVSFTLVACIVCWYQLRGESDD